MTSTTFRPENKSEQSDSTSPQIGFVEQSERRAATLASPDCYRKPGHYVPHRRQTMAQYSLNFMQERDLLNEANVSSGDELYRHVRNTTSDKADFRYRPLPDQDSIRVLMLRPGTGRDELRGSLKHVTLDSGQGYEAVSYVWGAARKRFTITLDDCIMPITRSAYSVLLRLRDPLAMRELWIDAVCISQADSAEKSIQVAHMGKIFSRASRVPCWLGEDSHGDGPSAFRLLQKLGEADSSALLDRTTTHEFMRLNDLPGQGDLRWLAAFRLFQRPWFLRIWVIQEFVFGRKVSMICGDGEVSWESIQAGFNYLFHLSLLEWGIGHTSHDQQLQVARKSIVAFMGMLTLKASQPTGDHRVALLRLASSGWFRPRSRRALVKLAHLPRSAFWLTSIPELFKGLRSSLSIANEDAAQDFSRVLEALDSASDQAGPWTRVDLPNLLAITSYSVSSDARDRFFALLSLSAQKNTPSLQPDYSESAEATYIRFIRYFLLHPGENMRRRIGWSADLLTHAGTAPRATALNLPSWIATGPSLSDKRGLCGSGNMYSSAAGKTQHMCRSTGDERTIYAIGGCVDVITRIILQPYVREGSNMQEVASSLQRFFAQMDEVVCQRTTSYPYLTAEETHEDVLWRTLVANTDESLLPAPNELRDSYLAVRIASKDSHRLGVAFQAAILQSNRFNNFIEDSDLDTSCLRSGWGWRWQELAAEYAVCETQSGLIGLVPSASAVGDNICILYGEGLPLVMRSVERSSMKCQIIGACYVHGIMQGEAITADDWCEEEFCLA